MASRKHQNKRAGDFICPLQTPQEASAVFVHMKDLRDPDHGVRAMVERHGYFIVPDLLDSDTVAELEGYLSQDLQQLVDEERLKSMPADARKAWADVKQEGVGAWSASALKELGNINRFQLRSLPHSRFSWACRCHNNVLAVYQALYATTTTEEESIPLVSGCDNAFVANHAEPSAQSNRFWPHVDMNEHDSNHTDMSTWKTFQGLVYLWSAQEERASTTVIWPGSHVPGIYGRYMRDPKVIAAGIQGNHFTPLTRLTAGPDKAWLKTNFEQQARRTRVPAGGGLFWDSRTTHQGWSGGPRLAQPVCWEPASRRSETARQRKMAMVALGLPSTHWASLGQPHSLVRPKTPTSHSGYVSGSTVAFPLRPTAANAALRDGVDPMAVWTELQNVMPLKDEPMPAEKVQYLEGILRDDIKRIL